MVGMHFVEQIVAWVLVGERTVEVGLVGECSGAVSCSVERTGAGQGTEECKEKVKHFGLRREAEQVWRTSKRRVLG